MSTILLPRQASPLAPALPSPRTLGDRADFVRRPSWRPPRALDAWLLVLVVGAVHAVVGLHVFARMGSGMDLAIFDQGVRTLSHLQPPTSPVKGIGRNLWGDHFHPAIALLAPLLWLWDDPRMLLLAQAVLVAGGCAVLCRCAARLVGPRHGRLVGIACGLSFGCSPAVGAATVFDMHEVALGVPLLALALAALLERRWTALACWSATLLLVKEDAGLLVFGLGMVALLRGAWRLGTTLCVAATAWTLLVLRVVIPAIGGGAWTYAATVPGWRVGAANLWASVSGLPDNLALTLLVMAASGGLLALRSPLLLVLLPSLVTRAASGQHAYWGLGFHYNLLPAVVVAFAGLDVLQRSRHPRRWGTVLLGLAAVLLAVGPLAGEMRTRTDHARVTDARTAIATIPRGDAVAADARVVAQLTRHHPVTQLVRPHPLASGGIDPENDLTHPLVVRWIVLDEGTDVDREQGDWVPGAEAHFRERGFREVRRAGDFVVLHR